MGSVTGVKVWKGVIRNPRGLAWMSDILAKSTFSLAARAQALSLALHHPIPAPPTRSLRFLPAVTPADARARVPACSAPTVLEHDSDSFIQVASAAAAAATCARAGPEGSPGGVQRGGAAADVGASG